MKKNIEILKLYPKIDSKNRYNYHVNYGVWDNIKGHNTTLEYFNGDLNKYDVVFLPMYKRWVGNEKLFQRIKESKVKTVLFDNDSCYRSFDNEFYDGIDLILYRDTDKNGNIPRSNSMWLPWSINTNIYSPKIGGDGILFSCSVNNYYPLRQKVNKIIKNTPLIGDKYISSLQNSGACIHTDNDIVPMVRAKALEISSCGTQIISNITNKMDFFFPDDLIIYFSDIGELREIIKSYKVNIEIQRELSEIVKNKHSDKIRSKEVMVKVKEVV